MLYNASAAVGQFGHQVAVHSSANTVWVKSIVTGSLFLENEIACTVDAINSVIINPVSIYFFILSPNVYKEKRGINN